MPPPKIRRGKSPTRKRGIRLYGHHTSLSLEDPFWVSLKEIAAAQGTRASQLVATVDKDRRKAHNANLSSAIRLFVLNYYRQQNERGRVP